MCCFVRCILILASVLLRVPPLKFTSLPISLPPSLPPSLLSPAPLLPPYSARFLPPLFPSLRPCLSSFLNPSSTPAPTLPHIIASSLPPLAPSSHPPSFPACLPAPCRPIQCTPYVCLASCTVLCSAQPGVALRQWGVRARRRCRFNGPLLRSANVLPLRIRF